MCGIAGIATTTGAVPGIERLNAMIDTLRHRGPDGEGTVSLPGCGLAHRRLAIIDLSGGAQPMSDDEKRWWVTFNGEIYNFRELRREMESRGHRFRTSSDTEVLVQIVKERGVHGVPSLRGMFAFAAWDARERQLLLARDRIGKKPLYWFRDAEGLYFASEIKALLTLANCPRTIDPVALDRYLAYQAIPGTTTIFKGVYRLAPASTLTWSAGTEPRIETYWRADWTAKTTLSYEDARQRLRELIVDATRARLIADVPLGAFLSGGVDSSAVVAAMAECSSRPVKTFSIGFPQKEFNETHYARMVAQKFGTEHEEFVVEPHAIDILPKLAWHYDQPYADSSALPTFYVSQMTRQRVTVALNGDGGDEWFGGYERYRALLAHDLYRRVAPRGVRQWINGMAGALPTNTGRLRKARLFTGASQGSAAEFNLRFFNHREFETEERSQMYSREFADVLGAADADAYFLELMADGDGTHGLDVVDRALRTDTLMYLPDTLLVKVDIAAMAVSLETRSPLLDTAVMEFAASLPRAWKVTATENKKILKDAHRDILPREVLDRRKMGFSLPLSHWFRNELYGYVREHLLDPSSVRRGYFRREAIERLIEDHRNGRRNNASRLWSLLMLEHWHREIFDAAGRPSSVSDAARRPAHHQV